MSDVRSSAAGRARVLVIDNYDSFTFNLVQVLGARGVDVDVVRNDAKPIAALVAGAPDGVILSPGPGAPRSAGVTLAAVKAFAGRAPILGVCLGHQAIGEAFGGRVVRSAEVVHGKATRIAHDARGVFAGLPQGIAVGRYHSLVVDRATLPSTLEVSASSPRGEIMGMRHRTLDVEGVQFHPESILTEHGEALLENWIGRLRRSLRRSA
ncbi:MAG: aminodeoxychorismate/anthranilate synthase component II [Polyangiaceae bacterium]